MKASEMRKSRASRLLRAATLTAQPSAVATAAAPSTSQKWAGWFSQLLVHGGACEHATEEYERRYDDCGPDTGAHHHQGTTGRIYPHPP